MSYSFKPLLLGLALGATGGAGAAFLFQPQEPDTYWQRIEWKEGKGYVISGGGVGTFDLRDNLREVGRSHHPLNLPLGDAQVESVCLPGTVFSQQVCLQRNSCGWFIVQYSAGKFQIEAPKDCDDQLKEMPIGLPPGNQ